jgi:phosphomevalonate kinase
MPGRGEVIGMVVTVPGNLLLLGEYAVLERGGLGIAVAPERRLTITVRPSLRLRIVGTWRGKTVEWDERGFSGEGLLDAIVQTCGLWLGSRKTGLPSASHITIDSSPFFDSAVRKGGFGSSAAVSVGLTYALLKLAGLAPRRLRRWSPMLALGAHRKAQGGKGSGYDIYTSYFGGVGLFRGGDKPAWRPLHLPWLPDFILFRGEQSVATGSSIQRYGKWRDENPQKAAAYVRESNRAVRGFARGASWDQAVQHFQRFRDLSLQLGRDIGVPADIRLPQGLAAGCYKALGAGNEIGICADAPADPGSRDSEQSGERHAERLVISRDGLKCLP